MGVNIDLYRADKASLVEKTMEYCNTNNRGKLIEVFNYFMIDNGGEYILLNNEYYEEVNPYYLLMQTIDSMFGTDNWQSEVWFKVRKSIDDIYHEQYEIEEKFNIKMYEEY